MARRRKRYGQINRLRSRTAVLRRRHARNLRTPSRLVRAAPLLPSLRPILYRRRRLPLPAVLHQTVKARQRITPLGIIPSLTVVKGGRKKRKAVGTPCTRHKAKMQFLRGSGIGSKKLRAPIKNPC